MTSPPTTSADAPAHEPQPLDLIFIEGFIGQTVIGIHSGELDRPQPLVIDVHAGLPRAGACSTDDIADTIDYSVLRERLQQLMREHRLKMLESFAEAIADIVLGEFGAVWVRVKVVKPKKFDDVQAMGVQIERRSAGRTRTVVSPVALSRGAAVLRLIGAGMVPDRS